MGHPWSTFATAGDLTARRLARDPIGAAAAVMMCFRYMRGFAGTAFRRCDELAKEVLAQLVARA